MKKLLLIFFLFHSLLNGQSLTGQQIGGKPALRTSGTLINISDNAGLNPSSPLGYVQRAVDFFKRVTDAGKTLTDAQKRWYNDSIFVPLLDSGLIGTTRSGDSLQAVWTYCKFAADTTILKMNLLSDSNTCTNTGAIFTDSGVVGGANKYLITNLNPIWDSSICKFGSLSFGVYSKKDVQINNIPTMTATDATSWNRLFLWTVNEAIYSVNKNTNTSVANATSLGMFVACRDNTTRQLLYKNGVVIKSGSVAASNLANATFILFADDTRVYPYAVVAGGLSADKQRKLSNILNNALKGRLYNVY